MTSTLLRTAAWLVAALALVLALQSLVEVFGAAAAASGRPTSRVTALVGVLLRTGLLGALAYWLHRAAAQVRSASDLSWEEEQFATILAQRRAEIPTVAPRHAGEYERLTDLELLDVYGRINAPAYPERFQALLWVIARRAATPARTEPPAVSHLG